MNATMATATFLLVLFAGVMILGVPVMMARTTQRPVTRGGKLRRAVLLLIPEAAGWGVLFQALAIANTPSGITAHQLTGVALLWDWVGLGCTLIAFAAMIVMLTLLAVAALQTRLESHRRRPGHLPAR